MDPEIRQRAEARLEEAAERLGLRDPREPYRDRLRLLREQHPDAFDRAIAHYESTILPRLAEADDPLATWLEYGTFLGQLTAQGRSWRVDAAGRASSVDVPVQRGELVLFVPDESAADVLIMAQPEPLSAAQSATIDLLVKRKLSL